MVGFSMLLLDIAKSDLAWMCCQKQPDDALHLAD
jgi:hypothetical protein